MRMSCVVGGGVLLEFVYRLCRYDNVMSCVIQHMVRA